MENDTSTKATATKRPRLYSIVHTYIQKQLPRDIHPAFKELRDREEVDSTLPQINYPEETTSSSLVEQESKNDLVGGYKKDDNDDDLPLEEIYRDAASEERLCKLAIEAYEKETKDSKYKTNIINDATHTWEEVLAEVNAASERYNEVPGLWGKIRKGLRSFGVNNQVFDAWAGLLPTQSNYFSVICGGLKLIFSAAARLKDLRSQVCEALAEIPILLASTHRALGAFRSSRELCECSAALYSATIATLRHIVEWYQEKAIKKFSKSLFKQSSYEQKLTDLIQAIRTHSRRFDDCAKMCSYEILRHTNDSVRSHRIESQNNHQDIVGQLDHLKMDQIQQNSLIGNIVVTEAGNIQQMMGVMANRFSEISEGTIKELIKTAVEETLGNFLASGDRMDFRTQDVREPMLPIRTLASESQLLKERQHFQQRLMTSLDYEDSVLEQDVETKLRSIWTSPRQDQDRVISIMRSPKLQNWITTPDSSALFVNANHKGSTHQSPTSFISAKLIDSITATPSSPDKPHLTVSLAYFCSEHMQPSDSDFGSDGMLRNLISQLLLSYPSFSLQILQHMHSSLDYTSTTSLCSIFSLLISQLPPYIVVFCIIDSITFFEDNTDICSEASTAVQTLTDIVERTKEEKGRGGCVFKLLLTSSWNSRVLYKEMVDQKEDVVWMPAKVPPQGGFTGMKWNASVGSNLAVMDGRLD